MYDPASFDVILPARAIEGAAKVAHAAVTLSPTTAALLCDRIGWARGSPGAGAWLEHDDQTVKGLLRWFDNMPRYYQPQPMHREMEIERALKRLPAEGYVLARWQEHGGRLSVGPGAMAVAPFGVSWRGTVFVSYEWHPEDNVRILQPREAAEMVNAARRGRPPEPFPLFQRRDIGAVETGVLALAVLRQIADGTIALHGREPI